MSTTTEDLSFAQRTCLRRLARGESPGDLAEALGALYLAELVEDGPDGPRITDLGRRYLDTLDQAPPTRKVERPPMESMPIPAAWEPLRDVVVHRSSELELPNPRRLDDAGLADLEAFGRDIDALVAWARHERAVRAQEGGR